MAAALRQESGEFMKASQQLATRTQKIATLAEEQSRPNLAPEAQDGLARVGGWGDVGKDRRAQHWVCRASGLRGATYTYQSYSDLELWGGFLLTQANQNSSLAKCATRRLQQDLGGEDPARHSRPSCARTVHCLAASELPKPQPPNENPQTKTWP